MAYAWWAFYGSDYDRDTSHLTMIQDGAYFRMLRSYYATGEPLPVNTESLVRICGAHSQEEIEAISFILNSFFSLKSDGWHNKRADKEIREAKRISKVRRNARLGKRKSIVTANDSQLCRQSQSQSHTQEERSKTKAASAFQLPDWILKESWETFEEMRRKVRKPMTDRARALIVTELYKLKAKGNDPTAVLEQSIRNSWQDVYELRGEQHGTSGRNNQEQPKPNAAVQRYHNNRHRIEQELSAMGAAAGANGSEHAPGLGSGPNHLLGDGTKTVLGR